MGNLLLTISTNGYALSCFPHLKTRLAA